jgi:hypothetical protein
VILYILYLFSPYTGCPIRYRTQQFVNNFTTNDDIATKFEVDLPHCEGNVKEKSVLLFKVRCNIFIGVRIIKEMPGSVASGTPCICTNFRSVLLEFIGLRKFKLINVTLYPATNKQRGSRTLLLF